jgi:hypothetical protein
MRVDQGDIGNGALNRDVGIEVEIGQAVMGTGKGCKAGPQQECGKSFSGIHGPVLRKPCGCE